MTQKTRLYIFLAMCAAVASATGCATQPPPSATDPPGFLTGLIHGFGMVFNLISEIWSDNRIYAFPNSGSGYDIGFFLGASAFLGAGGASSRSTPSASRIDE
jgi:hypothetical protein